MIPAYLLYRHMKSKKQAEAAAAIPPMADRRSINSVAEERESFHLHGVAVKRIIEGEEATEECFVNGKLSIVEKTIGVMIEWVPLDEDGWELANCEDLETVTTRSSPDNATCHFDTMKLRFSVDIKDLRSFQCVEPKRGNGCAWIRFISKDGSGFPPVYFRQGGLSSFTECLQRYSTLKRSAREANLVLFTDERIEALEQSVSILNLNLNNDLFSRFTSNPYATAMTSLGKVASFIQEQVIPSLLDADAVTAEEHIQQMKELQQREEEGHRVGLHVEDDAGFELVTQVELPKRTFIPRNDGPVTPEMWNSFKNPDGSFKNVNGLKDLIFRGGVENAVRCEAWKYLLGVRDWNKSIVENDAVKNERVNDYYRMKLQWKTIFPDQEKRFSEFASRKGLIEKDVARTDRTHRFFGGDDNGNVTMLNDILMTYCMYNFDLGYVQGMSDFLSPILLVMQNEVDAFWTFVKLMDKVHDNFEMDQSVIKRQLMDLRDLLMVVNPKFANYLESHKSDDMYFCFRWILIWFKREFSFDDIMRLWEILWTGRPCKNFLLLVCVAILDKQMNFVIENKFGLTEILKHVNDLTMNIDLKETLTTAEAIFHQLSLCQDKLPAHVCNILSIGDTSDRH